MKPIQAPLRAALLALPLTFLVVLTGCDADGPRSGEIVEAVPNAASPTRSASATVAPANGPATAKAANGSEPLAQSASQAAGLPTDQADDALITAKVSTGLAIDKTLRASRIEVATRGGVVTLKGPAPTAAARARAEEIARNVQGVTAVENRLSVQSG